MRKLLIINIILLLLLAISSGLLRSENEVSLVTNPLYQPILNSISNKSNLISTVNNLSVVSSKNIYKNYYLVRINNKSNSDSAFLVVQNNSGNYSVVLGPGTNFNNTRPGGIPAGLYSVLIKEGLIINAKG